MPSPMIDTANDATFAAMMSGSDWFEPPLSASRSCSQPCALRWGMVNQQAGKCEILLKLLRVSTLFFITSWIVQSRMALCDPCYDLFRILQQESCKEQHEDGHGKGDGGASATAFCDWILAQDNIGSTPETVPQLPGLIHSTWESFCKSLDCFCPVCWIVWRHIRESPMTSYRDQVHQKFYLWLNVGYTLIDVSGNLVLLCCTYIKTWDPISLRFKRTTQQRFEEIVSETPLEGHMGSGTTVETVQNWLSKCEEEHSHGCVAESRAVNNPTIPTRLIDLHSHDSQTWSLIETKNLNDPFKYVALSHRWTADTPRLLKSNYLAFQTHQPDKDLPRSYEDVFVLCRKLEIQYAWIDSLCIFQDSAEDFLREAATMTDVYTNAVCTFSISWESPSGFLRPREPRSLARWDFSDQDSHAFSHRYVFVEDERELPKAIGQTPLNQRGWVLQEQLLSPRILYLGNDQIYWQCHAITACETAPMKIGMSAGSFERKNILTHENGDYSFWQDLVFHFMRLDLTFERDRLLAISGIARSILSPRKRTLPVGSNPELHEKRTDKSHQAVEYVAGLQRDHWIQDLLWFPAINATLIHGEQIGSDSFDRRPDNLVPSWSWAACPGPIRWPTQIYPPDTQSNEKMPGSDRGPMAYLRNINFEPLGSDVYGLPKSASLEISCLLVQARYAIDGESRTDQTEDMCFYANTYGFLLPLPYPRTHSGKKKRLSILLEPCTNTVPTCFIVPIDHPRTASTSTIECLVVQERPQSDISVKMREFVRIGSFGKTYFSGADEVIHALLKNLPVEGDEFEQKLRDSARAWKEAERVWGDTEEKGTAKAEWTTIRLV